MTSQVSFYDGGEQFIIDKPIRLIELFSGIGAQAKALTNLGVDYEHYRTSEWDIYSIVSYNAVHIGDWTDYSEGITNLAETLYNIGISADGKVPMTLEQISRKPLKWQKSIYSSIKATNNIGSIVNAKGADLGIVETDKYCYIVTYSFPCQDLSKAGKQKGMAKDGNTRSGMLWQVERLLDECAELPQVLLMENVPDVVGTKFISDFAEWIAKLDSLGYVSKYEILNSKDYGIPQNRERCFMVSILGDYYYEFPEGETLTVRLKDVLEDKVDESYYISDAQVEKIINSTFNTTANRIYDAGGSRDIMCERLQGPEVCKTVRTSGRGSLDRHSWDMVIEDG